MSNSNSEGGPVRCVSFRQRDGPGKQSIGRFNVRHERRANGREAAFGASARWKCYPTLFRPRQYAGFLENGATAKTTTSSPWSRYTIEKGNFLG